MFTFDQLDDLALAARARPDAVGNAVRRLAAAQIGPLAEYVLLRATTPLPSLTTAPRTREVDALQTALTSPTSGSLQITSDLAVEFAPTPSGVESIADPSWIAFQRRMQHAAVRVGFDELLAAGFVGAAREFVSNVLEHSGKPRTGFIGYRVDPPRFEFVIADRGVGALTSLRSCAEFATLTDAGEALRLCIQDGVSRLGAGHGNGFRPLFLALAAQRGFVRVRSDDQAIQLSGIGVGPIAAVPVQKPIIRGFLVSVEVAAQQIDSVPRNDTLT